MMNAIQAKKSSAAFHMAAKRCLTERRLDSETLEIILIPGIVCAVFSVELGFKAIILHAGDKPKGHKLCQLFIKLDPKVQNEIINQVGLARDEFLASLGLISDAYVQWRYHYEYTRLTMSLSFLDKLVKATQYTVADVVRT